jgi:hypothetical protein
VNHRSSIPKFCPVTYCARTTTALAPTAAAKPRATQTRPVREPYDFATMETPSAASQSAVHAVIRGQDGTIRVNSSTPDAQPTQSRAATSRTIRTAARPQRISAASARGLGLLSPVADGIRVGAAFGGAETATRRLVCKSQPRPAVFLRRLLSPCGKRGRFMKTRTRANPAESGCAAGT